MDFFQAIKTCLRKYATFKGRAARSEFWYWALFSWLLSLAALAVDGAIAGGSGQIASAQPVSTVVMLAMALPGLAVSIRRLHDVNRSGWWFLVAFTGIGCLLLFYWSIVPGRNTDNRYDGTTRAWETSLSS